MRRLRRPSLLVVVAALVAIGAVLVVVARGDEPAAEAGAVALVGDSLNVGTLDYLDEALPGWRVRSDSVVGRLTDDGLVALESLGGSEPLLVSLGTNDPKEAVDAFRADVDEALRLAGPERCVVWATIWRSDGADEGFNAVLEEAASQGRLRLLRWDELLDRDPSLLAADGVHGSPAGYRARAEEAARILRTCPARPEVASSGARG